MYCVVLKITFDKMLELLNETYRIEYIRGDIFLTLSILTNLQPCYLYYCNYRIMENTTFGLCCFYKALFVKVLSGLKTYINNKK